MIRVTRKTEPHDVIDSLNDELQHFGLELQEVNPGEDESEFALSPIEAHEGVRWERLSPALIRAEIGVFEALVYDDGTWFIHGTGTVAHGREVAQSLATRRVIAVVRALSAGP